MGFMDRLLGRGAKPASAQPVSRPAQPVPSHAPSTRGSGSPQSVRKELVRVCTRETLVHNGIPADWIRAEPLTTAQAGRESGVHVRLLVLHWDPRLMHHAVAIQELLEKRILALDPQAEQWLMGLSWQFALQDVSQCPALPHPGSWTQQPAAVAAPVAPAASAPADGNADVISGPTRIRSQQDSPDARKELERMLSERDADFRKDADDSGFGKTQPMGFDKTQPMGLDKTQPMGLDKAPPLKRE